MPVIRFTSEYSAASESVNVWHFFTPSATTALANECVAAVDTFFEAIKAFLAPGTWTHGQRVVTVDGSPNIVVPATALTTTTTGATHAPYSAAAGVSWTTAFIGKSYRGRSYIGPMATAALQGDGLSITGTFQTALLAAATALHAPTTSGAELSVWSAKLAQNNVITGASVPNRLRTQRRRLT